MKDVKKVYNPQVDTISIYYYYIDRESEKSTKQGKKERNVPNQ